MRSALIGLVTVLLVRTAAGADLERNAYGGALFCHVDFTSRLFGFNGYHSEDLEFRVDARRGVVIDASGATLPVIIATPTEIEADDSAGRHLIFFPRIGAVSVSSKFSFGALTAGFGKCRPTRPPVLRERY